MSWDQIRELREPLVLTAATEGVDVTKLEELDARKVLILPFVVQGDLLGIAVLDEPGRTADFDAQRIGVGQAVAGFAALMINNARLYERQAQLAAELTARSSTMEALLRLGYDLRATLDLDRVLERVAETVLDSLGYREVGLFLYDEATETFVGRVALGGSPELDGYYLAHPIPKWVFDAGARSVNVPEPKKPHTLPIATTQMVPVFDDPVFLDKLRRFVAALASRYDGNPNIAFIDIRSYGNCGEDNVAVWSGLSAMREIAPEKLRAHVQIYMDAFQRTPLCLTWGAADFSEIYDWAAAKGVWLRHDGVCGASDGHELALCDGHVPAVFECSGEYLQMKQVGWWDGKQSVAGVGYTLESSVERGHPSFASLGQAPWDTPQLLKDEPQLLARLSNRLGYNIVLRRAEAPTLLRPGEPARLRLRWENTGVAPMFRRRVLGAALLDNNGRALSVCWPSGSNVSNWVPGKLVNEEMQLVFHDATPGRYMLAIGLFDNIGDAQPSIRLANDMQVLGGWHVLNALSVEAAAAPAR